MIWDVGGLPPLPGGKLVEHLVQQAKTFHPMIKTNEKIVSIEKNNQKININFLVGQDKLDIKFHKTLKVSKNTEKVTQINTSVSIKNEWQIIGFNSVNEKLYCPQKNCFFCRFD